MNLYTILILRKWKEETGEFLKTVMGCGIRTLSEQNKSEKIAPLGVQQLVSGAVSSNGYICILFHSSALRVHITTIRY